MRVVQHTLFLLQRDKLVSTNTGAAVASGLVSHGELGKVVANHFSLKMRSENANGCNIKDVEIRYKTKRKKRTIIDDGMHNSDGGANLDLDVDEELAVVDTHDGADHLGDDGHVSQVRLDSGGLVEGSGSLLSLAQLLEKSVVSTGDAACETTTNAASQKLQKLLLALVQQSLELNATEAERKRGYKNVAKAKTKSCEIVKQQQNSDVAFYLDSTKATNKQKKKI